MPGERLLTGAGVAPRTWRRWCARVAAGLEPGARVVEIRRRQRGRPPRVVVLSPDACA